MGNPVSEWIKAERKRRGWKVEELSRRLIDAGYPAEINTVRVWEARSGRPPKADTISGLERLFGSQAPRERESETDLSALVAALDRQTAAITALADEIRADRSRQGIAPEAVTAFLRQLASEGLLVVGDTAPSTVEHLRPGGGR